MFIKTQKMLVFRIISPNKSQGCASFTPIIAQPLPACFEQQGLMISEVFVYDKSKCFCVLYGNMPGNACFVSTHKEEIQNF